MKYHHCVYYVFWFRLHMKVIIPALTISHASSFHVSFLFLSVKFFSPLHRLGINRKFLSIISQSQYFLYFITRGCNLISVISWWTESKENSIKQFFFLLFNGSRFLYVWWWWRKAEIFQAPMCEPKLSWKCENIFVLNIPSLRTIISTQPSCAN